MLSCKDVAELASHSLDRRLSWRERLGMRLHLFICRACPRYVEQLRFLHRILGQHPERLVPSDPHAHLSHEARSAIRRALERDKRP